jgi:hypothetical protein
LLLVGEMFHAVAEQPADLIKRVVFVAAAAEGVLLHAPPHLIDHLVAQPHHMKCVEDRDRVREAVADGFGVAGNGSNAACSTPSRKPSGWAFSQAL